MNLSSSCSALVLPLVLAAAASIARSAPVPASAADATHLRYAHPTVTAPFPDLMNLGVPPEVGNRPLATLGYVDVTALPFGADPTGGHDSTAAIQAAVDFARDHQMSTFFPPGTYRVSDTIQCIQQLYKRSNGRVFGSPLWPNVLVGSRAGRTRPRIVLAPRSPGFGDPDNPRIVVSFWARGYRNPTTEDRVTDGQPPDREQPNISFNQVIANLEIAVGEGNPGAIALRHQGAEGSGIFDCTIDATGGFAGIYGGIGSGGSSAGVTVIGGRFGLDFSGGYAGGTQPTPCITGFTLRGQTEAAIRSTSRQAVVASGLRIEADACAGPLILVGAKPSANSGALCLVDSEIVFGGAALDRPERVVVASPAVTYLDNVYVRNATQVVVDPEAGNRLLGRSDGWLRVAQYARPSSPRTYRDTTYRHPVYQDGQSLAEVCRLEPDRSPPADLQARHLWNPVFPSFETRGAANVKAPPYGARGDGRTDDTAALQRAIDENEIVFLPKGLYRLTATLELRPRTKLVGVGQTASWLVSTGDGAFAAADKPAYLVRTADTADAETALAFLGFYHSAGAGKTGAVHWRSGGRSVVLSVTYWRIPHEGGVRITGHGGGNWYNTFSTRVTIEGTREPLRFYQFSCQKVSNSMTGARNVSVHGIKYEGTGPVWQVRDCDQVRFFATGGNVQIPPAGALLEVERTPALLLACGLDGPTGGTPPATWHLLSDRTADGSLFLLPPLERPVLYQHGRLTDPMAR